MPQDISHSPGALPQTSVPLHCANTPIQTQDVHHPLTDLAVQFICEELGTEWFCIRLNCQHIDNNDGQNAYLSTLEYQANEEDSFHPYCAIDSLNAMRCIAQILKEMPWQHARLLIKRHEPAVLCWW